MYIRHPGGYQGTTVPADTGQGTAQRKGNPAGSPSGDALPCHSLLSAEYK